MASHSQDREDLLRDATAFARRVQLQIPCGDRPAVVFAGFRASGAVSFYFDQDPVYHFNTTGQLRRAFVDDTLVKAEAGRLIRLHRQRSDRESALIRDEMTVEEQQTFCHTVRQRLSDFLQVIVGGEYVIEGQVLGNANGNVVELVKDYLKQLGEIEVADSSHITG